jgi:hypothetical protein
MNRAGRRKATDELSRMIRRVGLESADPRSGPDGATVAKTKRIREVLSFALDQHSEAGVRPIPSGACAEANSTSSEWRSNSCKAINCPQIGEDQSS